MPAPTESRYGIGLDTGGTFTDIVLFDLEAERILRKVKTPTTHGDYAICIRGAFRALELTPRETKALARVALSTTLATNTVAEDKVHPTALLIEPGDIAVPAGFHPHMALLRSEIGFDAQELAPVSEEEVLRAAYSMAPLVEGFAVSGYASTRNPDHERRIGAILAAHFALPVVLGSDLSHQLNFMQRASAAALNAGLLPVILEWLRAVRSILEELEIRCPLYIVKGDGSLMEEAEAMDRPVQTLFSGPAASLRGGAFLLGTGYATSGMERLVAEGVTGAATEEATKEAAKEATEDAIVIDVGGTTTDIGRMRNGMGQLRTGGLLVNHRQIAVDGLDISTYGLGGDSRLRLSGKSRYRFENRRVLPFCRAVQRYPSLSMAALEAELEDQWHFGDPELLELAALDQYREERLAENGLGDGQRSILAALGDGPRRVRALSLELGVPAFARELDALERRRLIVRIGLTPTDLYCAEGKAPEFSREAAQHALRLYARMMDHDPAEFQTVLGDAARGQATATLSAFLIEHGAPAVPGTELMERLTALMLATPGEGGPLLGFYPGCKVVLVGAGAPVLFGKAPEAMAGSLVRPPDGDVANAVGAVTSSFLLRESVTIEPLRRGRVELYDHQGKWEFPGLEEAMEHGRKFLKETLEARADKLGLRNTRYELSEEIMEDYADYSRRSRKELVIARLEAMLLGMPS